VPIRRFDKLGDAAYFPEVTMPRSPKPSPQAEYDLARDDAGDSDNPDLSTDFAVVRGPGKRRKRTGKPRALLAGADFEQLQRRRRGG
jgi:hypothetical protein